MRRITLPGAIVLYVVLLYVFLAGVQQFSTAIRYPRPVPLTYADFVKQQPSDGWYTITDAVEWMSEYRGPIGPSHLDIMPLRGPQSSSGDISVFVLPSASPTMSTLAQLDAIGTDQGRADYLRSHPDEANVAGPVEGGIVPSFDPLSIYLPLAIRTYGEVDRSHVVLLKEGSPPRADRGAFWAFVAIMLGIVVSRWYAWSVDPFREERMRLAMHSSALERPAQPSRPAAGGLDSAKPLRKPTPSLPAQPSDVPWWERSSNDPPK